MLRIFTGANGYYVAAVREDGFHYQPMDNGSRQGWDLKAAKRELQRQKSFAAEADRDRIPVEAISEHARLMRTAPPAVRAYQEQVYPLDIRQDDPEEARLAVVALKAGRTFGN